MSKKEWLERNVWKSKPNNYEPQLQILHSVHLTLLWVSEEAENISLHNKLIDFYNWNGECLQNIEIWFIFFFKLLKSNLILQGNNNP